MPRKRRPTTDDGVKNTTGKLHQNLIQRPMDEIMRLSMIPYAEHVILERALPRVEDGLKPVQRRILFTMNELGITPDKPHKKCARIVGDCLGKYHPHGDSSVYEALVRLAQPYSMRGVLVDGHGNFGSIDGDSAAAMRYTEARMAPLALQMLRDIEKDTVPFSFNFDDTLKEPDLLPSRYPNLLVNGTSGIAVGLATNIPPHNLKETIQATIAMMDDPEISLDKLMTIMPGPDFPTGGILIHNGEIREAYESGRGKLTLRAKTHIEEGNAGRKLIVITEVPYQVSKSAMLERILKLSEEKKSILGGIYDIRDESDRTGLRAVIEIKKDVSPTSVLAALYKYSDLQVTFGVNIVAIAEGRPVQMGLKALLKYYINHQKHVLTRRTKFELEQARAREHVLAGLIVAVDHLDEVISIIRKSKNPKEAREQLENRFGLSEIQSQAILDIRLQRLTALEVTSLRKEYKEILETISRLVSILSDEKKLILVIKKEMSEIGEKYGDARRTSIETDQYSNVVINESIAPAEEVSILLTNDGQLKKLSKKAALKIRQQEDTTDIHQWIDTYTDQTIWVFTNFGNCWVFKTEKIPEVQKLKDRGIQLTALAHGVIDGERIISIYEEQKDDSTLLFVTEKGQVKRSSSVEYAIKRNHFSAISMKNDDMLICVLKTKKDDESDILLLSRLGQCIRFKLSEVSCTGRVTSGVRGISLKPDDSVINALIPQKNDNSIVLLSDRGYGKKFLVSDIERQPRAKTGQRVFSFSKNGAQGERIVGAVLIKDCIKSIICKQVHGSISRVLVSDIVLSRKSSPAMLLVNVLMDDLINEVSISER